MTTSETPGVEATPDDDHGSQSTGRQVAKAAAVTAFALTKAPLVAGFTAGRSAFRLGREVMAKRAASRGDTSGKLSTGTVVAVALGATVVGVGVAAVVLARRNEPAPPAAAPPSLREVGGTEVSLNGHGPAAAAASVTPEVAQEPVEETAAEPVVDEVVTVEDPAAPAAVEDTTETAAETTPPADEAPADEASADEALPVTEVAPEVAEAESVEVTVDAEPAAEEVASETADAPEAFEASEAAAEPAVTEEVDVEIPGETGALETSDSLDAVDTEVLEAVDAPVTAPTPVVPTDEVGAPPSTNGLPAGADRSEG